MIDLHCETVVSLPEACRRLPKIDGRKLHASTLWRWAKKGVRGTRLDHVYIGRRLCTSEEALTRFCNQLATVQGFESCCNSVVHSVQPNSSVLARERAISEAESDLKEAGI